MIDLGIVPGSGQIDVGTIKRRIDEGALPDLTTHQPGTMDGWRKGDDE